MNLLFFLFLRSLRFFVALLLFVLLSLYLLPYLLFLRNLVGELNSVLLHLYLVELPLLVPQLYVRLFLFGAQLVPAFSRHFRQLSHPVGWVHPSDVALLLLEEDQEARGRSFGLMA